MHIGLDKVELKSEGFTLEVEEGQRVKTGDPLIGFDANFLATNTKGLLTQIVVTNSKRLSELRPASGLVRANKDVAMVLELAAGVAAAQVAGEKVVSEAIVAPTLPVCTPARPRYWPTWPSNSKREFCSNAAKIRAMPRASSLSWAWPCMTQAAATCWRFPRPKVVPKSKRSLASNPSTPGGWAAS